MSTPMISVVMPVYNGEKYLREAIDSILTQTYTDFEFIILNDGSTDKTEDIILSYDDPRIVYVKNEKNLQIVKTLNKGIALAKGKYIARMDADDISLSERLEKQIIFMEENLNIAISGSYAIVLGGNSKMRLWKVPITPQDILVTSFFSTPILHPTAIIRKQILDQYSICYHDTYHGVEDYLLWSDILQYSKGKNLPEVLLKYRILPNSETRKHEEDNIIYRSNKFAFYSHVFKEYKLFFSKDSIELHVDIVDNNIYKIDTLLLRRHFESLELLLLQKGLNQSAIKRVLGYYWLILVRKQKHSLLMLSLFSKYNLFGIVYYIHRFYIELRYRLGQ